MVESKNLKRIHQFCAGWWHGSVCICFAPSLFCLVQAGDRWTLDTPATLLFLHPAHPNSYFYYLVMHNYVWLRFSHIVDRTLSSNKQKVWIVEWDQKQMLSDESAIRLLFHIIIFSCKYKIPESIKVIAEGDTMQWTMAPTIFTGWPQWQWWLLCSCLIHWSVQTAVTGTKLISVTSAAPGDDWTSAASAQS